MHFDPSPEEMQSAGQIWFPGHYDRIRWWVKEGESTLIRPSLPADAAAGMGPDGDVLWAEVGRLTRGDGDRVFAEWIVGRPDLGLSIVSSKLEPAVDSYYRELMGMGFPPSDRSLGDRLGSLADAVLEGFSSRNPGFVMLSGVDRAPVVDTTSAELLGMLEGSENVCPMKKAVYSRGTERAARERADDHMTSAPRRFLDSSPGVRGYSHHMSDSPLKVIKDVMIYEDCFEARLC